MDIHKYIEQNRISKETTISKKEKTLQQLRDEIENLPSIKHIANEFEKKCFSPIKKIFKKHKHKFSKSEVQNNQSDIVDLGLFHSLLKENEEIHDNLQILSHYLPQLKAYPITKNEKSKGHIMTRFLHSEHTSLNRTMNMIDKFKKDVDRINKHYYKILNSANKIYPLEDSVKLNNLNHNTFLDKLYECHNKQQEMAYHVGKSFVEITRDIHA